MESKFLIPAECNYIFYPRSQSTESKLRVPEENLINWISQNFSGDLLLDIGAHIGTYSVLLSSCFTSVEAFEPCKKTYYHLCGTIALNRLWDSVTCHNVGLHSSCEDGVLNIISLDGGGNSIHGHGIYGEEKIKLVTLDSYGFSPSFIKIDCEGNEENVIRGGISTISSCMCPILLESNCPGDDRESLFNLLFSLGYSVRGITEYPHMFLFEAKKKI